jgi:hypothetical protein
VTLSTAEKAANRAVGYRQKIAAKHADSDDAGAFRLASNWLLSEAAKVARHRPRDAVLIYRELTARLADLAEALPGYRPPRGGRS